MQSASFRAGVNKIMTRFVPPALSRSVLDHGRGIVKLTAERKNTFHSVTISSGSEALTSHLGIYNGLEMTSTSHSTTLFCRFDR
jgi:hypothetical protein